MRFPRSALAAAVCLLAAAPARADDERLVAQSAATYRGLLHWSRARGLDAAAAESALRVLRFAPHDAAARSALGYVLEPDGRWTRDEAARARIRAARVASNPYDATWERKLATHDRLVAESWRAAATEAARAPDAAPGRVAARWTRVLEASPDDEEARRALGHVRIGSRLGRPADAGLLTRRAAREAEAERLVGRDWAVRREPGAGRTVLAGEHFAIEAEDETVARQAVHAAERTVAAFSATWDVAPAAGEPEVLSVIPGRADAPLQLPGPGVVVSSPESRVPDAVASHVADALLRRLRAPAADWIAWLDWAVELDAVDRLRRPSHPAPGLPSSSAPDAKPRRHRERIVAARRHVEFDDDLPLAEIGTAPLFGDPRVADKGYAFLQFLVETDLPKARAFVRRTYADGLAAAARDVLGASLDDLDARYRDWILRTW